MKQFNRRTLAIGLAAMVAGLMGARAMTAPPDETPSPVDELVAVAEAAPEAEISVWLEDADWDLPVTRNERVDFWIDFLAGRNAEKTHLWLERLGRYGPMIQEQLRERGMPEDLVYLAMIESGLSPRAYSHAHASGMWQFIAETGKRYGLQVSAYVDERRDPVKATGAALDYLTELHDRFGSWYLAAASYNTGENRVGRIMRQTFGREQGTDAAFWRIDQQLPRETRDYVPLMLAAGFIGKDPAKHGFEGLELQEPLRYEEVIVPGAVPLSTVAVAAGTDEETVADLNPHLVRSMTPPGAGYPVRVPHGHGLTFAQNFERVYAEAKQEAPLTLAAHTVRRGETLSGLAVRYGTTVVAIQQANGGLNPRALRAGQQLRIPTAVGGEVIAAAGESSAEAARYRVRSGDSLWTIARRHGVSVRELQSWNGLGRTSRILPGQTLRIGA
ncbi:MAG: LysM peptidoglycan-binding domain-containing protein [Longimicrobiales bacterium]